MIINCPNCGQKVRTGKSGKYRCPSCKNIFDFDEHTHQEVYIEQEVEDESTENYSDDDQSDLYIDIDEAAQSCETCGRPGSENICKYCGQFVCSACVNKDTGYDACPACLDKLQHQTAEHYSGKDSGISSSGFFESFFPKLKGVLSSPAKFFSTPLPNDKLSHQYIFALICYCLGGVFEVAYSFLIYKFLLQTQDAIVIKLLKSMEVENLLANPGSSFLKASAMLPLQAFFMLAIIAGIVHIALLIFSKPQMGFPGTVKIVAYSNVAHLARIIPAFGGIIAFIWQVGIIIIGAIHTHRIKGERAALAVLLPVFALFGMILLLVLVAAFFLA